MVNLFAGQRRLVYPLQTIDIASTGLNAANTAIIYEIDEQELSYIPGRPFNQVSKFTVGKGYMIQALVDMDKSEFFMPPFTGGGSQPGGNYFTTEDGQTLLPES